VEERVCATTRKKKRNEGANQKITISCTKRGQGGETELVPMSSGHGSGKGDEKMCTQPSCQRLEKTDVGERKNGRDIIKSEKLLLARAERYRPRKGRGTAVPRQMVSYEKMKVLRFLLIITEWGGWKKALGKKGKV